MAIDAPHTFSTQPPGRAPAAQPSMTETQKCNGADAMWGCHKAAAYGDSCRNNAILSEAPFLGPCSSRSNSPNMQPLAPALEIDQLVLPSTSMGRQQQESCQVGKPAASGNCQHVFQPASQGCPSSPLGAGGAPSFRTAPASSNESDLCAKPHLAGPSHRQAPNPTHAASHQAASSPPAGSLKEWLYQLVTCSYLFKPCPECCHNHTGREVLVTYFDTDNPTHGYCTYCPERASHPHLLQIRRSTYHEVIKAADIGRITDTAGVQHYVINGSKVLFLRPRPQPRPPKGVVAPARCLVDGRQLMDHSSCYCSLRCKLEVEDREFSGRFPHEALQAADAAADAAAAASAGGMDQVPRARAVGGIAVAAGKRTMTAAAAAGPQANPATSGMDDAAAGSGDQDQGLSKWGFRAKRQRTVPSKYASSNLGQKGRSGCTHGLPASGDVRAAAEALLGADAAALVQEENQGVASPCNSVDSERSTTCNYRWHHKRKGEPIRSPLQ